MDAMREILQLQAHSRTISLTLPEAFAGKHLEVIVLPFDEQAARPAAEPPHGPRRAPSPLLRGTRITGDIQAPAIDPEDWSSLR